MTSKFDEYNNSGCGPNGQDTGGTQLSPEALDNLKRDRFELLSAYLDGEVSAAERYQVEQLLRTDPTMQRLYARLLKLRQGIRSIPIPALSEQSVETTVQKVVARIERRPRRVFAWSGMAIAAMFVGALFSIAPRPDAFNPSIAQAPSSQNPTSAEGLMIALNHPIVEIPKAAVSSPRQFENQEVQ